MASQYTYDEDDETWPYFVMATLTVILIPLTIKWVLRAIHLGDDDVLRHNSKVKGSIRESTESIGVENVKQINTLKSKKKSRAIFNKTLIVLVIGWSTAIYIALYFLQEANLTGAFDPYTILDVSPFATEREVKSRYRKLSLTHHPDKLPKDLTEAAKEVMEAQFIRLNLAYKALTDEVTRNNFLKFGHPDGPQDLSHGIALPKFLVEGKYSQVMLLVYGLLMGVFLPWIVGSWWGRVKVHTKQGLHIDTAGHFTRKLTDRNPGKIVTHNDVLDWILWSNEVRVQFAHLDLFKVKDLIIRHFERDFSDPSLESDKVKLISILPELINRFIDIAVVFRASDVILVASDLLKAVTQGVKPSGKRQEILQLPFVDPKAVLASDVKKLGKLFAITEEEAGIALGITDKSKLKRALEIASHIPSIRVLDASFVVPGEEFVTPSSNSHISVKLLIKSPRLKSCPEIEDDDIRLKDEETLEYMKDPLVVNSKQPELPFSYAPYFPGTIANAWTAFVIQQKDTKLVEGSAAYRLEHLNLRNLELSQANWKAGGDDVIVGTFKIPFLTTTPAEVGKFQFRLILKNNAYYGCDVDIPLEMEVKAVAADLEKLQRQLKKGLGEEVEDEDDSDSDISDPEDDSLAAALASLRGDAPKKKKSKIQEVESDDDNESVFTDINTDTEDEGDEK